MTNQTAPALSPRQIIFLALYGVGLWFAAALLVRVIGPLGWLEGIWRIITFALVIPGTVPAIFIGRRIAALSPDQTAMSVTIITAAALLLDGIAFAWFPALYAPEPALQLAGAAAIFWGAGVALVLGLLMNGSRA